MDKYFGYITYENESTFQFPFNSYGSYNFSWPWITYNETSPWQTTLYYMNLLIQQYHGLEKATATAQTLVRPVISDLIALDVQNGFQLNTEND